MKRTISAVIATAAILLSSLAHAETLHQGKVYQVTADRLIIILHLKCQYGPWEQRTLPNGATVISRGKVCQ